MNDYKDRLVVISHLRQSPERKDATKRYCKIHKVHYHKECWLCGYIRRLEVE